MGWSPFRKVGITHRDSRSFTGYTLITPIGGDSVFLLDASGVIVHQWQAIDFTPGYGFLLPNGNLLVRGQPSGKNEGAGEAAGTTDILLELDWDSNEIWRWEHDAFHHDMARLPSGNTLALIWEQMPKGLSEKIQGGYTPEEVEAITSDKEFMKFVLQGIGVGGRPRIKPPLIDAVIEFTPEGEVVNTWHAYDHFDPEIDKLCAVDFPFEWTHLNALELAQDGDILISSQKLDKIMKISWPDGKVVWEWGGIAKLSHQHDVTMTPEGNILVFDNGSRHPIVSRSRVIEIDPKTDEIVWQYQPKPAFSMNSMHIAGAERLANGNTLICEGETGRILEVTRDSEICWEWNSPFVYNFKGWDCVMLFRAHRYAGDSKEIHNRSFDKTKYDELNRKWGLIG